eukprot:TRINITY_DN5103_c0_g2_i3.p1 TRINITY_DN5103_c0_g2~~TRINITY_DN5103_c0_g2_i3.p1  ORF type:complete len:701 (+),score=145.85 TRINITY_DN5103_c0_g2_i3:1131-3233(+)
MWYGSCNGCLSGSNDLVEKYFSRIPSQTLDQDLDGVSDNCDICPDFNDFLDSDGDYVPNSCDQCPGFDDTIDTNNNGIPDPCDNCARNPCGASNNVCVDGVGEFLCSCDVGYRLDTAITSPEPMLTNGTYSIPLSSVTTPTNVISVVWDPNVFVSTLDSLKGKIESYLSNEDGIVSYTWVSLSKLNLVVQSDWYFEIPIEFKETLTDPEVQSILTKFIQYIYRLMCPGGLCVVDFTLDYYYYTLPTSLTGSTTILTTVGFQLYPFSFQKRYPSGFSTTCKDVDECHFYGCGNYGAYISCTNLDSFPDTRLCSCGGGVTVGSGQVFYSGDRVLTGSTSFPGCKILVGTVNLVDECNLYGCISMSVDRIDATCINSDGEKRWCRCDPGYSGSALLSGSEGFLGCYVTDLCADTNPCPPPQICTPGFKTYNCTCPKYFLQLINGSCVDPCSVNNGGCDDRCVSPTLNSKFYCTCDNPDATVKLSNRSDCACVAPLLGNGITCLNSSQCIFGTFYGSRFVPTPTPWPSDSSSSSSCGMYSSSSCCHAGLFNKDKTLGMIRGNDQCSSLLEEFSCSPCDPSQVHFVPDGSYLRWTVCVDFCISLFESCSKAWYDSSSNDAGDIPPVLFNLKNLTEGYSNPIYWCEKRLLDFLPYQLSNTTGFDLIVVPTELDRSLCFGGFGSSSGVGGVGGGLLGFLLLVWVLFN